MMYLALAVAIAALAVFFMSDCDPLLNLLPYEPSTDTAYKGQTVWITGASSGIGAQLALDFCSLQANVIISARRESSLSQVAKECRSKQNIRGGKGGEVMVIPLDVTDEEAQQVAYEAIIERFSKIDILVLNAGRSQRAGALDTSLEDSKSLLNLNVVSYIAMTKVVVPSMLKGGKSRGNGGTIMIVSSVAGKIPATLSSTYSATKYALHGYFDTLRTEYAQRGLKVLMVCPGPVRSEITKHTIQASNRPTEEYEQDEASLITTERCTYLMLKALSYDFFEVWIAKHPILFMTYMNQYAPYLAAQLNTYIIGPSRYNAFQSGNGKIYDMKLLIPQQIRELFGIKV
jgi:dehydrogenase/reductase SDR family protein 7